MIMVQSLYTTQLQAGLGMIQETHTLLNLWDPNLDINQFQKIVLDSGQLPNVSARRLRNIVGEWFAPRYLRNQPPPAINLKKFQTKITGTEIAQLFYIYTCRANSILYDFVIEIYWPAYSSGRSSITTEDAERFVLRANQDNKTYKPWSDSTIRRISGYLTGCCADFGLLESRKSSTRKILPFRIEPRVAIFLAYDLHFSGSGDNSVLSDPDWSLFGMDRNDVLNELKQQALRGWVIIQSAGDVTRIDWQYQRMEDLIDALITR
jgi:hypothetical protein